MSKFIKGRSLQTNTTTRVKLRASRGKLRTKTENQKICHSHLKDVTLSDIEGSLAQDWIQRSSSRPISKKVSRRLAGRQWRLIWKSNLLLIVTRRNSASHFCYDMEWVPCFALGDIITYHYQIDVHSTFVARETYVVHLTRTRTRCHSFKHKISHIAY